MMLSALLALSLAAGEPSPAEEKFPRIEVHAELLNAVLYRSDSDFDPNPPAYDANGKSVGFVGTVLRPGLDFLALAWLRLHYDAELGLNYWSRNDPDVESALAPGLLVMKHRQLYAEGELANGAAGFRAGFSRFIGPTGLFVNHWIGNAQGWWARSPGYRYALFVGQLSEGSNEGIDVERNNFSRDITLFGARGSYDFSTLTRVEAGVEAIYDAHVVGHSRLVATPSVRVNGRVGPLAGFVGAALQLGSFEGEAMEGRDQTLVAWALQAHGVTAVQGFEVTVNLMVLSPDDDFDGNGRSGAFLYSGRSSSSTVLLTEDETLDWRDNLDKRLAVRRGGFWENRAGLTVADVKAVWAGERYRPGVIVGAATVLNPSNALGAAFVGLEADAVLEVRLGDHLQAQLLVGTLVPGAAGAALVNRIDMARTTPVLSTEASLRVTY
ncbi:MAG: hypothetical protein ACYC8T_26470 [Myxococcaceae bacterium]